MKNHNSHSLFIYFKLIISPFILASYIILIIIVSSCKLLDSNLNNTYKPNRKWNYEVIFKDSLTNIVETQKLQLEVTDQFYPDFRQTGITWTLKKLKNNDTIKIIEKTGIIDNETDFFLHPPRMGQLYFTNLATFPHFNTTDLNIGYSCETGLVGIKSYNGKQINKVIGKLTLSDTQTVKLPAGIYHNCYIFKSTSSSVAGVFHHNFIYHKEYGILKMHFIKPDKSEVIISLKSIDWPSI